MDAIDTVIHDAAANIIDIVHEDTALGLYLAVCANIYTRKILTILQDIFKGSGPIYTYYLRELQGKLSNNDITQIQLNDTESGVTIDHEDWMDKLAEKLANFSSEPKYDSKPSNKTPPITGNEY